MKIEDLINKVVFCSDGQERRLTKIEDDLLHYEVPVSGNGWLQLEGTRRSQVEKEFLNGEVI